MGFCSKFYRNTKKKQQKRVEEKRRKNIFEQLSVEDEKCESREFNELAVHHTSIECKISICLV
jgi:hypothetical protein